MGVVGIRDLKQNASAIVARAIEGEVVTISHRGRPVAVLTGLEQTSLGRMVEQGLVEEPTVELWELPLEPSRRMQGEQSLSETLLQEREGERY
ncbi:type II toxin-antitoxin system Phd/YefM family antitoxin [Actinomyces minihominis]|uniref:type II toxin-antitoxin system Phd/YefM family antitoxin n=1 Tax=Actinomyces minihominis TaxID=2002838 RepID=UPI000C074F5B|nr:type II toxin-antitoxin system Phd/YefM family antitoxin [Actinomyces minihominis]